MTNTCYRRYALKSRPYKQYCTTTVTAEKAEAILIGSRLQGALHIVYAL